MPSTAALPWIGFHIAIVLLLALEWLMGGRVTEPRRRAVYATILWVAASLALAAIVLWKQHAQAATEFLAGYVLEESLSIDNLFVFLVLFGVFRIPEARQQKVLFWGVLGAILLRGGFIAGGLGLLERFAWIEYVFGGLLLVAAVRLLLGGDEGVVDEARAPGWIRWVRRFSPVSERQDSFWVTESGRGMPTVLLLALVAVELTDILFALDSIPAVLSVTRSPFLAYTSNILAVMGLRSLYVLLAAVLTKIRFLHYGLAAVLAFAAFKMLGSHWMQIGPLASLAVIAVLLGLTLLASFALPSRKEPATPR
jgi:tellurite resistance protein TerC